MMAKTGQSLEESVSLYRWVFWGAGSNRGLITSAPLISRVLVSLSLSLYWQRGDGASAETVAFIHLLHYPGFPATVSPRWMQWQPVQNLMRRDKPTIKANRWEKASRVTLLITLNMCTNTGNQMAWRTQSWLGSTATLDCNTLRASRVSCSEATSWQIWLWNYVWSTCNRLVGIWRVWSFPRASDL